MSVIESRIANVKEYAAMSRGIVVVCWNCDKDFDKWNSDTWYDMADCLEHAAPRVNHLCASCRAYVGSRAYVFSISQ